MCFIYFVKIYDIYIVCISIYIVCEVTVGNWENEEEYIGKVKKKKRSAWNLKVLWSDRGLISIFCYIKDCLSYFFTS